MSFCTSRFSEEAQLVLYSELYMSFMGMLWDFFFKPVQGKTTDSVKCSYESINSMSSADVEKNVQPCNSYIAVSCDFLQIF